MNYIRHLSVFYLKAAVDDRLNAFHISLYNALFQLWNLSRFEKAVLVNRQVLIRYSKIGSNHTLYRCLNELHNWGYIQYVPSFSPRKGTFVQLCNFDTAEQTSYAENAPDQCKNDIGTCADSAQVPMSNMHSNINSIYTNSIYTNISEGETQTQNSKNEISDFEKMDKSLSEVSKRKKVALKKEKGLTLNPAKDGEKVFVPPTLDDVLQFFMEENYVDKEGRKFFYHFESNGWKVGGKTPMKNWHAAAHNWMLNSEKYKLPIKKDTVNLNKQKNYDEPL